MILFREDSAFKPKGSRGTLFGLIISDTACDILKERKVIFK